MNHKRHRPRLQHAGCACKAGKKYGRSAMRGGEGRMDCGLGYGNSRGLGGLLRLRVRAQEAA